MIKEYFEIFEFYSGSVVVKSECNQITFINNTAVPLNINGLIVAPNNQYVSTGNTNELNTTLYTCECASTARFCVIRKLLK